MGKIKQFLESDKGKDILIIGIIILVGLGSFELGRLSKNTSSQAVKIENSNILQNDKISVPITENSHPTNKNFFASSRGSKYYPVNCSAGKNIKESNKVYFLTGSDAERAGYTLSSSCK